MDNFKSVKKIIQLVRYDMKTHIFSWLFITGFYATLVMIVFGITSLLVDNFDVTYWGWVANFFFDWIVRTYALIVGQVHVFGQLFAILIFLFFSLVPLGIMKNTLDLAFDSVMSGAIFSDISISLLVSYVLIFILGHVGVGCGLFGSMVGAGYFLSPEYEISRFLFHAITYILLFLSAYAVLLLHLFCMHFLEYRKNFYISMHEFYSMIVGKHWLIGQVFCIQIGIAAFVLVFLRHAFGLVFEFLVSFIMWFFIMFDASINQVFMYMLYNFFYVWVYLCLYAGICLLAAHLYRQLVCPPLENLSCSSCNSCSK